MTKKVHVVDTLQNYSYELIEPEGMYFDIDFKPQLTPAEMLQLGVFGGHYFQGEHDEFPTGWFENARISEYHNPKQNYFAVNASQSRQEWIRNGWINDQDPRGWFQWYCRYYLGRRTDDDARQVKRWKNMTRHIGQIKAHCHPGDMFCRPGQRQALLHWAYDSRKF